MKKFILYLLLFCSLSASAQLSALSANNALLEDVSVDEILRNHAFFAYDFTNLTGSTGDAISNGNAGLQDLSLNNRDATIVGSPVVRDRTLNGVTVKTLEDNSTHAVSTGFDGAGAFSRTAFRILMVVRLGDGQPSASTNLMGAIIPTNQGINVWITSGGRLRISYGNSDGTVQWESSSGRPFTNGISGIHVIEIQVNFDTDDVTMRINGESMAASQAAGDITTINPANWTNTRPIYIGSLNNDGTALSNPTANGVLFAMAMPYYTTTSEKSSLYSYLYDRFLKLKSEIHVTSEATANSLRSTVITEVFNGAGLPTATPTLETAGYTGNMHICQTTNITNDATIDKWTTSTTDVDGFTWTYKGYLMDTDQTELNILVINVQGHISDNAAAHEGFMSEALGLGYDVLYVALPVASNDNTETNPTITLQSTGGHDQIKSGGLDDETYNALELFLYDKIVFINEFEDDYDAIYINGISGGGWCTIWVAAIDTRISKACAVRGYAPRTFRNDYSYGVANGLAEGDYEQGGSMTLKARTTDNVFNTYSVAGYIDLALMATTGGRVFHSTSHRNDSCCFVGLTYDFWENFVAALASSWGGNFDHKIDTDGSRATHMYSTFDIAEIFATYDTP